jgi:metal-responsive CopG/Arc/MetJ family transcriptional regulator
MKEKASITLSPEVLAQVDRLAGTKYSRSALIERVLRKYFRDRHRAALHARDVQLINQAADELNAEALDVLQYQAPIDWSED